jgi:hypothetical protein
MNAIAVDSEGKLLTIHQKGKILARYLLNDSAVAIRDIVHCNNEHKPMKMEARKTPPQGDDNNRDNRESGYGTGFFVAGGKILTNYHTIN